MWCFAGLVISVAEIVRKQDISLTPRITLLPNFLSREQCADILDVYKDRVLASPGATTATDRTSSLYLINMSSPILDDITELVVRNSEPVSLPKASIDYS